MPRGSLQYRHQVFDRHRNRSFRPSNCRRCRCCCCSGRIGLRDCFVQRQILVAVEEACGPISIQTKSPMFRLFQTNKFMELCNRVFPEKNANMKLCQRICVFFSFFDTQEWQSVSQSPVTAQLKEREPRLAYAAPQLTRRAQRVGGPCPPHVMLGFSNTPMTVEQVQQ